MHPEKRPPARREGLALWMHVRLVREFISLPRVTTEAGRHDIFPSGAAPFITGQDMVEIELSLGQDLGAVLAGKFIPQEDIAPSKFHLKPW